MTEEKITAKVDSNYDDRRPLPQDVSVYWDQEYPNKITLTVLLSKTKEDDYITINMTLADLLNAIGKAIRPDDN